MRAGLGPGGSREALSCSQLCIACSVDAERVRESEVWLLSEQPNTSVRMCFPVQVRLTYYFEIAVAEKHLYQDINAKCIKPDKA